MTCSQMEVIKESIYELYKENKRQIFPGVDLEKSLCREYFPKTVLKDFWGRDYLLAKDYYLICVGEDGKIGTSDDFQLFVGSRDEWLGGMDGAGANGPVP